MLRGYGRSLLARSLPFASSALLACTGPGVDGGPAELVRTVQDSGQNRALSFDGVDDYVSTGTAQFPDGRSAQTFSAWFLFDGSAGRQALLAARKDYDSGLELELRDGIPGVFRAFAPDRELVAGKAAVTPGVWHFIAFTFDQTTNVLYLDGERIASSTTLPDKRTPTTFWLGTIDGSRDLFAGSIDTVHVFDVARTPQQIAAEYAGTFVAADAGPVLDLSFDESSGSVVYDRSAYANDGLLGDGDPQRMPARVASDAPHFASP